MTHFVRRPGPERSPLAASDEMKRRSSQAESRIEMGRLMLDRMHMIIAIPPRYAVSQVVG